MLYDIEEEADEPDATNEEIEITRGVRMLKCLDMIKSAFYSCRIVGKIICRLKKEN